MTPTPDRRRHPRFVAWLPLRLKAVGGIVDPDPVLLLTLNLSKAGLCFHLPQRIEPGQSIEVEVTLLGAGPDGNNIFISSTGYIVRAESARRPGWYKLAATFDESPSGSELDWQKVVAAIGKKS
jgi:hypothetical protein